MTINYCQSYNKIITKEGLCYCYNKGNQSKRRTKSYNCH